MPVFLTEGAEGVSNYRSMHNLTKQVGSLPDPTVEFLA